MNKNVNKFTLFVFSIILLGCSTHLERKNLPMEVFVDNFRGELIGKNLIVHLSDSSNVEGMFNSISPNHLSIYKNEVNLSISLEKINFIIYKKASPPWIVGALSGLLLSVGVYELSGADYESSIIGEFPVSYIIFPVMTTIGVLISNRESNYYKTIYLHK